MDTEKLQGLLKARMIELEAQRPSEDSLPSTEEQILEQIHTDLVLDEIARKEAADRAQKARDSEWYMRSWSIPVAVGITILTALIAVSNGESLMQKFQNLALAAGLVAAVGAGVRLWAHGGSQSLDGLGKMLGFSAAFLAVIAAGVLLATGN